MVDADTTNFWWPVQSWILGIVFIHVRRHHISVSGNGEGVTIRQGLVVIGGEMHSVGCLEKGVCDSLYTVLSSSAAASTTVVGWYCGRRTPTAKAIVTR